MSISQPKHNLWITAVLIVAATLFTLVLITITLYFAFDAVLLNSRDEHVLRARGLVIAGAVLAVVLVAGLLASTSLVAFVNAYNDGDQVIIPLSLHHVILSALILLWAITVLGGQLSNQYISTITFQAESANHADFSSRAPLFMYLSRTV